MLTLVVNERLEEAMTLKQRIVAGVLALGAGGLGTHMARTGGSTAPPATLTRSIGGQETKGVPTNTTLAQPKAKARTITSVKPEDTGPESKRPKKRADSGADGQKKAQYDQFGTETWTPEEEEEQERQEIRRSKESERQWRSRYGLDPLPKDALDRAKETPEDRQKRLHREGKVKNSYLPDK